MQIAGKRIVVTGAGRGVGAALVTQLRSLGATVVGVDLAGADEIIDVSDPAACRELAQRVVPDVWVNNAGVLGNGSALTQPDSVITRTVEVNVLGVMWGSRAAANVMATSGGGLIVNVGSLAAWVPVPGETVYSASKHAVRAFSQGLNAELRGTGVRVCTVCPDGVWSPMIADKLADPSAALSFSGRRLLTPDEVAAAIVGLIRRPSTVVDVPRSRGLFMRLMSTAPGLLGRFGGVFYKIGRRHQMRLATKVRAGTVPYPDSERPPAEG